MRHRSTGDDEPVPALLFHRDTRKLKKPVGPCSSLSNSLIYNERGATVLPQNATTSVLSATRPLFPGVPTSFLFSFKNQRERERRR
jgi:hypothetical protein